MSKRDFYWEKKRKALTGIYQDLTADVKRMAEERGFLHLALFDDYPPQIHVHLALPGTTIPSKYFDELGYVKAFYGDDVKELAAEILGAICKKYDLSGGLSKKAASAVTGTLTYVLWKD